MCNAMFVNMYRMDDASNESLEVMDKDKEKDRIIVSQNDMREGRSRKFSSYL